MSDMLKMPTLRQSGGMSSSRMVWKDVAGSMGGIISNQSSMTLSARAVSLAESFRILSCTKNDLVLCSSKW